MAAGLGVLRLDPDVFWSMTVTELRAVLSVLGGRDVRGEPPSRGDVWRMMQRFPDEVRE